MTLINFLNSTDKRTAVQVAASTDIRFKSTTTIVN